jgi:mannose-6-phosphate isomerase-like protein (cupin superfamily)
MINSNSVEYVYDKNELLAVIIRHSFREAGVHFATPNNFSQQLAYMRHSAGKVISPHIHNPILREVFYTQEVLVIRSGRIRVDFYNMEKAYLESRELCSGDVILLASGGHGFEVLEDLEMIEVKQGPFAGDMDKVRFDTVSTEKIIKI